MGTNGLTEGTFTRHGNMRAAGGRAAARAVARATMAVALTALVACCMAAPRALAATGAGGANAAAPLAAAQLQGGQAQVQERSWDGTADTSWYDADADSFVLSTPEQVAGLAQIVNGTAAGLAADTFRGKTVSLAADLTLNVSGGKRVWTAIGDINIGQEHATATNIFFDGTFDGAGHVVNGLYMPSSSENYGGYHAFFGALGPHAVVERLGIASGSVSGRVAAGIAAVSRVDDAQNIPLIAGCFNRAEIHGNGATSRGSGGIFGGENQKGDEGAGDGYRAAAYIADCYNAGEVSSSGPCGGIAGTGSVKMYACYNVGTVYSTTGGSLHGALIADLFAPGSVTAASFLGAGEVKDCYAYVGTDEHLYRILDADHTPDDPAYPGEYFGDDYYNPDAAFLDALQFDEGSSWLGSAFVDDDQEHPANDRLPLLWWQAGKDRASLATATVEDIPNQLYTGAAITPALKVHMDDPDGGYESLLLNRGGDYRVEWSDNLRIGTATATVVGVGRYAGTLDPIEFQIVQIDLSTCTVDDIAPQWFYGGAAEPPVVVRSPDGTELWEGEDYTVTYSDNTSSGEATVTVDGNDRSTSGQLVAHFHMVLASDHLEGSGTAEDPYLVSSKYDLQYLSHEVNTDNPKFVDAHFLLTCDVDASAAGPNDLGIDPIGINTSPFAGTFDGGGHAITLGMDSSKVSDYLNFSPLVFDYLALFSCTGSAGTTTIRDLTVRGSVTSLGSAAGFIGSAVDKALVMENCTNEAEVKATSGIGSGAAGFVAVAAGARLAMTDCANRGNVRGTYNASGLVVYLNGGSGEHRFVHCGNAGMVTASQSAGGVVQHYAPASTSSFTCENCYNTGSVSSTRADGGAAGGILGMVQSDSANASVDKACSFVSCYNSGNVSGGRHAGGVAGQIYTTPMNFLGCYNTGTVKDTGGIFGAGGLCGAVAYKSAGWAFRSCYGAGQVSGKAGASPSGALLGWCFAGSQVKLENCYVPESMLTGAQDEVAGIGARNVAQGVQEPVVVEGAATALPDDQMKARGAEGLAAMLGSIFSDDLGANPLNGGYPVCYWQAELVKRALADVEVQAIPDQYYAGGPVKVSLQARMERDDVSLQEGVDYVLDYVDNVEPGTATVTMTGLGRYQGQRDFNFRIVPCPLEKCQVAEIPDQWSTETGARPALTVTNPAGNVLEAGADYQVDYADNVASGTATATVTASDSGHYEGSTTATFAVVQAAAGLDGAGAADDPYRIGTAAEFAYFMAKVNAGEGAWPYACYELTADLELAAQPGQPSLDPVGTARNRFRGQFDGAGHRVVLSIEATQPYAGLFGVADGATFRNVVLEGSVAQQVTEAAAGEDTLGCAAALVAYSFDTLHVSGCTNRATVASNGSAVAGLVGIADAQGFTVELENCTNEGTVSTPAFLAGGLVADARAARLTMRGCANEGAVKADYMAAGLLARPGGSVSETTVVVVSGSRNTGDIMGKYRSGGLVGSVYSHCDVTVRNSYNTGRVASALNNGFAAYLGSGTGANGGLVGGVGSQSSLAVERSYNAGALTSSDSTLALGGLVGYVNALAGKVVLGRAFYAEGVPAVGNQLLGSGLVDGSAAVSDTVLKSSGMPERLGTEFGFDTFGQNGGYPIVGSQRADIAACGLSPIQPQRYTGSPVVPAVVVHDAAHDRTLQLGRDYLVVCEGNVDACSGANAARAYVVGMGSYAGEIAARFDIAPADLADCTLADIPDQPRTGQPVEPELSLANEHGVALVAGVDYTAGFSNNVNAGSATVVVRGKGNYTGVLRAGFDIVEQTDLTGAAAFEPIADQAYTGQAVEPAVELTLDGVPLLRDVEYQLEYFDNVQVGTARVVATGLGAFAGTVEATFRIVPRDLAQAEVSPLAAATYTGRAICPEPTVTLGGTVLAKGTDYTLEYRNNVNAGTATVVITGAGAYSGAVEATFAIKALAVPQIVVDAPAGGSGQGSSKAPGTAAKKKANPMKVTAKAKSVAASKLKKSKRAVAPLSVRKAQGKVTFAKVAKGSSARLTVNKTTGKVTVKKGTKAGTYKVRVKVKARGNAKYKPATKTVTAKVKVTRK